jgi:hypothetical protein
VRAGALFFIYTALLNGVRDDKLFTHLLHVLVLQPLHETPHNAIEQKAVEDDAGIENVIGPRDVALRSIPRLHSN